MLSRKPIPESVQTNLGKAILGATLTCSIGIGICSGCSVKTDPSLEPMGLGMSPITDALTKATPDTQASEPEADLKLSAGKLIAKNDLPSPGRLNAFELTGEFHAETTSQDTGVKREIFIIGFVEVDKPSVMLSIDGRTQTLLAGETFERITVLEIAPPRARISCDGVSWNASIFDRRSSSTEVSMKKKSAEPTR